MSTTGSRGSTHDDVASSSTPTPLSPLSEVSSLEDEPRRHALTSEHRVPYPWSNAFSTSSQNRRRRALSRVVASTDARQADLESSNASGSVPTSSDSLQAHFNPEAAEFVPGARMPSKRKASSSARPGKSVLALPRSNGTHQLSTELPLIRAEDIFGKDPLARSTSATFGTSIDDDGHSEIFEFEMPEELDPANEGRGMHVQRRVEAALSSVRGQGTISLDTPRRSFYCNSAILFSCSKPASATEGATGLTQLRYLPLVSASGRREMISKNSTLTIAPSHRNRIDATVLGVISSKAVWPNNELPVEIFDLIADYLSRDDVQSMRLVSKEFEKKVSFTLFKTCVVPFNTELYDMIDEDTKVVSRAARANPRYEGKAKAKAFHGPEQIEVLPGSLNWQNAKEDAEGKVYKGHGLRVFQGFGPHIRRFGMSFEVAEGQLARTPVKKELDHVESYFGSYDWPQHQYTRFAGLAGLERTADDTMRMKLAFSNLRKVQELALSLDSGLGWLNGPDKSMRAQIFDCPSPIFGRSRGVPDRQMQEAQDFWGALESSFRSINPQYNRINHVLLNSLPLNKPLPDIPGLQGTRYADPRMWCTLGVEKASPSNGADISFEDMENGILYTSSINPELGHSTPYEKTALVPSELRKEQKEWLLETEWAQRAFLECYILAIMDNQTIFSNVKKLKLAKVSSGLLPLLARSTFWDALPGVSDVTIHVKPDWRIVERDNAGFAEVCNQNPSEATRLFHKAILRDRICLRSSITKLDIGWVGGGEHAEGIFARNANMLPAPITPLELADTRHMNGGLVFKFVEHLTLTNCWLTPPTLEELVQSHADKALKKLILNSVSLTAHPRFPVNGQAAPQIGVAPIAAPGIAQGQQAGWLNLANQNAQAQQAWLAPWMNLHNQNQNGQAQAVQQMQPAAMQNFQFMPPQHGWGLPAGFANIVQGQGVNLQPAGQPQHLPPMVQQFLNNNNNNNLHGGAMPFFPVAPLIPGPANTNNNNNNNNPFMQTFPTAPSHWSQGHREGSWPELLDRLSPGTIFTDYLPKPAPWEEPFPVRPPTNLRSLECNSCGYVRLPNNTAFDQTALAAPRLDLGLPMHFRDRHAALAPAMMSSSDRYLARIVQHIPLRELDALLFAWGMTHGWADHARAEEAEFDGVAPGGTGRFSGCIEKDMELVGEPALAPFT